MILDWNTVLNGRELIQPSNTKQDLMNKIINDGAQRYISTILKSEIEYVVGDICKITVDERDNNILKIQYPKDSDN